MGYFQEVFNIFDVVVLQWLLYFTEILTKNIWIIHPECAGSILSLCQNEEWPSYGFMTIILPRKKLRGYDYILLVKIHHHLTILFHIQSLWRSFIILIPFLVLWETLELLGFIFQVSGAFEVGGTSCHHCDLTRIRHGTSCLRDPCPTHFHFHPGPITGGKVK